MSSEKLTREAYIIAQNYEDVNVQFITLLAEQVAEIEKGNIDLVAQQETARLNINSIKKEMQKATAKSVKQTDLLLKQEAKKTYKQMAKFYKAKNVAQLPINKNRRVLNSLVSIGRITNQSFANISNTTAMSIKYKRAIDRSILAVQSGAENYQVAIDRAMRQAVKSMDKVTYSSDRTRRLDTAVRMNVLDGVRQVQLEIEQITGEEFGADGWEIDAHSLCAPDHLETDDGRAIQGGRFTNEEFEELQSDLARPIGEYNCQHMAHPIVMGVSSPAYSEDELEDIAKASTEELEELDGMTRYEASQQMRKLETNVRENEEQLLQARIRGRDDEINRYSKRIKKTKAQYRTLCKKANLKPQPYRMKI